METTSKLDSKLVAAIKADFDSDDYNSLTLMGDLIAPLLVEADCWTDVSVAFVGVWNAVFDDDVEIYSPVDSAFSLLAAESYNLAMRKVAAAMGFDAFTLECCLEDSPVVTPPPEWARCAELLKKENESCAKQASANT